jgi:hypothetical protein
MCPQGNQSQGPVQHQLIPARSRQLQGKGERPFCDPFKGYVCDVCILFFVSMLIRHFGELSVFLLIMLLLACEVLLFITGDAHDMLRFF